MTWKEKLFGLRTSQDVEPRGAAQSASLGGSSSEYGKLSDDRLIRLLFTEADQLPSAASEVVARGRRLVPALSDIIDDGCNWHRQDAGW